MNESFAHAPAESERVITVVIVCECLLDFVLVVRVGIRVGVALAFVGFEESMLAVYGGFLCSFFFFGRSFLVEVLFKLVALERFFRVDLKN